MKPSLYLADDVYCCISQGFLLFLDLNRDAYSAIPVASVAEEDVLAALEFNSGVLIAEGLLSRATGQKPAPCEIDLPVEHVFGFEADHRAFGAMDDVPLRVRTSIGDAAAVWRACDRASRALSTQHISATVGQVRSRKARATDVNDSIGMLAAETAVFRKLRPWYPRPYLCLFDALALIEFLARRRLFPTWVFAVNAQPFGAHCWVQEGNVLLNENLEFASQFTPIMSV